MDRMSDSPEGDNMDDEEDMAELEAMLYSRIYYQSDDCDKSDFLVSAGLTVKETPPTPGGDSGCGLSHGGSEGEEEEEVEETDVSKYFIAPNKSPQLVKNPYFESDVGSSDSDSDDGIIVLPKMDLKPTEVSKEPDTDSQFLASKNSKPTEVIEMDSSSNHSESILLSDDEDDEIKIVEEIHTVHKKNDRKTINDSFDKNSKKKICKSDFGSDFSDNFLSSNESDDDERDISPEADSELTLNLRGTRRSPAQKVAELVGLPAVQSKSSSDLPSNWTKDMNKFYNEVDETYLDVDLKQVLAKLPQDKEYWRIDRTDVYGQSQGSRRRYWTGRRCNNCHQPGHLAAQCPEPLKPNRCQMCGEAGHTVTSCPVRSCLWCGQPAFDFLPSCLHCRKLRHTECRVCGLTGHVARDCPDGWRRYHATTKPGEIVNPGPVDKPDADCWCCNCGARGHLVTDCYGYKASKYPNTRLRVVSYEPDTHHQFLDQSQAPAEQSVKMSKKKKSRSSPSTPKVTNLLDSRSEPASPVHTGFPSSLLVEKAIQKLDKRKKTKDGRETKRKKEKLNQEIIRIMNQGKSKKQILAEILSRDGPDQEEELGFLSRKKHLKSKQIKTAISTCMSQKRAETREKEWRGERGFGKAGERGLSRSGESGGSRANLVPTDCRAAVRFLKKEVQKVGSNKSSLAKRLSKELNQEIFGLKNLQTSGVIKKVERKRLADIVLQLRELN